MKHFIIDGNNLIGKINSLNQIHKKNKKQSAEKLAFILNRYFNLKKAVVSLHFDGVRGDEIKVSGIKIFYSGKLSADEKIKEEITSSNNSKNIILVTSDSNLAQFGRVCSCQIVKSEEFAKLLLLSVESDEEKIRIEELDNTEEFKKLFGLK